MRFTTVTVLLVGALIALPAAGFAQTGAPTAAKPKAAAPASHATHAVRGTIKSMDAHMLVLARAGKKDMTFTLSDSTQRSGTLAVGSQVSVRYQRDGSADVAMAVAAEQPELRTASRSATKK